MNSSSLKRVFSVARNTFREAVRDRVLYNLVLFVLLITAAAVFLGDLTAGYEARVIVNMGLSAALVFGAFIAIFVGVSLVSKEIEKRTVYAILSKPLGRGEFIVGKYLGLSLTLLVNVVVMGAGISLALFYVQGKQFIPSVWCALALIFFELTILTATATLFSSFSSPALSALMTFFIFVIGHFSASLKEFAVALGSQSARVFFEALYYVLPNLSNFTFITPAAHGQFPSVGFTAAAAAYAAIYVVILLSASILIFSRRNFK
jgi:ABC-type transport system involved in multi-copper enzyme maturation permease subunit